MAFSINNIKKLVYNILNTDAILINLLGGNSNIFHFHPRQESNITYPIVVYNILGIEDDVYDVDRNADINRVSINIDIFSSKTSTEEADNISDRIYALLHNQEISNNNIIVYTCFRVYQDELLMKLLNAGVLMPDMRLLMQVNN
jgi:hypothetical protein